MKNIQIPLFICLFLKIFNECTYNYNYECNSGQTSYTSSWESDCFQTPPRGHENYKDSYQDMNLLVGYAQQKYSSDRKSCTINFITFVNPSLGVKDTDYKILYTFGSNNDVAYNSTLITSENSYKEGMPISARIIRISDDEQLAKLELENEYFLWDVPEISGQEGEFEDGKKGAIVELFGWPFDDIAEECDFLSVAGYLGVKIIPPHEYISNFDVVEGDGLNPWWYFFQTVSYKLKTRLGDKKQLINMIYKCRKVKIRVYSEVVINNMVVDGNDEYKEHKNNNCDFVHGHKGGSAGSPFWTLKGIYENNPITNKPPVMEFPSVPYCGSDFHCKKSITNYGDIDDLSNGWLTNEEVDLNTGKEYVQQRIADFFTELISLGITGFSINNAKHIHPNDLVSIFKKFKENLGGQSLPTDFLAYLHFNLGDKKNELICNEGEGVMNYGKYFNDQLNDEISKIQILTEFYPNVYPDCDNNWSKVVKERYVMSIENQNIQNVSTNNIYFKYRNKTGHKLSYINMLNERDIGNKIRLIFSSYSLINGANGFPDGYSDCRNSTVSCSKSVPYVKAYAPLSKGYDTGDSDNWIEGNYTRIHRDIDIVNAVRSWLNLAQITEDDLYRNEIRKYEYMMNPTTVPQTEDNSIDESTIVTDYEAETNYLTKTNYPTEITYQTETNYPTELTYQTEITYQTESTDNSEVSYICEEKCATCDEESKKLNLCLSCNIEHNYFPVNYGIENEMYYECLFKNSSNPDRFYFEDNQFKPCYETCLQCIEGGNPKNHKCLKCEFGFKFRPDGNPADNCIANCIYYYITPYGQYKCLKDLNCPDDANLMIIEKSKCIDDCKKDDTYKYQYNGKCLISCPDNTIENNFLCQEIDINKCSFKENEISINDISNIKEIENLVKKYNKEYSYTEKHISEFKDNEYNIFIYKTKECINELQLKIPIVDFGNCYNKVKDAYKIIDKELIISIIETKSQNNPITSYSFFHPLSGEKLNATKICEEEVITVEENILSLIDENSTNYEMMIKLTKQGINIFNISDKFYTELCYEYESPVKKDIALKDRIQLFYPNVSLCDTGCENVGINLDGMSAKCNCKFNDIANNNLIKDNVLLNNLLDSAFEIINESNLAVLKCYKYIFKYFNRSYGGYICLILIFFHLVFSVLFFAFDLDKIKRFVFNITQNYLQYIFEISKINNIQNKNSPPHKKHFSFKGRKSSKKTLSKKSFSSLRNKKRKNSNINSNNTSLLENKTRINLASKESLIQTKDLQQKLKFDNNNNNNKYKLNKSLTLNYKKHEKYFNEYLATPFDAMEYDDAIEKDNRKFCEYFSETVKDKQVLSNTFCSKEDLKPRSIKIILLILNIILYFSINGLFFSEDYISEVYHLKGEEKFFTFFPRSINRFFYTTLVSIIIGFIVDCFFIEEKKIKRALIREKDNKENIKAEIIMIMKEIKNRYLSFIIVVFIILIICFYYLLCFNYVYPYIQYEWIKSSITIFIIIQILSIFACLLETILRFISFRCKSEKIYKLSKIIN